MQVYEEFDDEIGTESHREYSYVEDNLEQKVQSVGRRFPLLDDVRALYRYMTDGEVPWYSKGLVIAALAYFISPLDAVPDVAPILGYLDDIGVIALVLRHIGKRLQPYYI